MPAFAHVDLGLSTGNNDGTDWVNAWQDTAGLVSALSAAAAGEVIYIKNTSTTTTSRVFSGPQTLASLTNPVRIIGVKSAVTRTGASIIQADLIPGNRTGNATQAYDQTGGDASPFIDTSASNTTDMTFSGSLFIYALRVKTGDIIGLISNQSGLISIQRFEECGFEVTGSTDEVFFGGLSNSQEAQVITAVKCKFTINGGLFRLASAVRGELIDCVITSTQVGLFKANEFTGDLKLLGCDLSGVNATLSNINDFQGGILEFLNCKLPASYILTTGAIVESYAVVNYGGNNTTGLGSADSEQEYRSETHIGVVDEEVTKVRTGGADDEATGVGGPWSYALTLNNVTDNFISLFTPWMGIWVEGDGTAKTITVHIASDESSVDRQDDETYLQVEFPDEAGTSIFNILPNEGAPRTGTLDYDAQTANFTVGAILTGGTSGAHGIITADTDTGDTGTLTLEGIDGVFQNNETITDDNGTPGSATANGTLTVTFHGGRMQLLGTVSTLIDDTGSTWGGGVGNHQILTHEILPDYRGLVRCRVHDSKSGGAVLYVDPLPIIT